MGLYPPRLDMEDAVYVVGHHDKCAQGDVGMVVGDGVPAFLGGGADGGGVQDLVGGDGADGDVPEKMPALCGADGDKIGPFLAVVVAGSARGGDAVAFVVVGHTKSCWRRPFFQALVRSMACWVAWIFSSRALRKAAILVCSGREGIST